MSRRDTTDARRTDRHADDLSCCLDLLGLPPTPRGRSHALLPAIAAGRIESLQPPL
jgi:hypothetical protein